MPEDPTSFPKETEQVFRSMLEQTSERTHELKAAVQATKHFRAVLKEIGDSLSHQRPLHVRSLMDKHDSLVREQCESSPYSLDDWNNLRGQVEALCKKTLIRYPKLLETACAKVGLTIDSASCHPEYTFEDGFFELKLDRVGMAALFCYGRLFTRFPGDVQTVVERLQEKRASLFDRPFEGEKFLRQLRTSYANILLPAGRPDGESVPIREIIARMTGKGTEHTLEEFMVDFSRLVNQGPRDIDRRRLELEHTRDPEQGILLHHVDTFGYIGFVRFEEVGA